MSKRLAVFGAGAIGGQVGARLAHAGHDVTIIDPWEPQVVAISNNGLTIQLQGDEQLYSPRIIRESELEKLDGPIDILFLSVKSYDTLSAIEMISPYLGPDSWVVSMQNSINEELIAPIIGPDRTLGGVILINAVLLTPGRITSSTSVSGSGVKPSPGVYAGEFSGPAGTKAQELQALLSSVWPAETTDNLLLERWTKLATNCMVNPVSGLSTLGSKNLMENPTARKLMVKIGAEVIKTADAHGYQIEHILGDYSPEEFCAAAEGSNSALDENMAERATRMNPEAKSSMLQDVLRGRRTEIDYFNGLVDRKASEKGIETPLNRAMVDLIHKVENGEISPGIEALEQVRHFI
jgi:2-dehydropantoate 2-reductase